MSKIETQNLNNNNPTRFLLDASFQGVNRNTFNNSTQNVAIN